ncbi:MAG: hypothetical protein EOP80_21700, partial [Variovorax sp.]
SWNACRSCRLSLPLRGRAGWGQPRHFAGPASDSNAARPHPNLPPEGKEQFRKPNETRSHPRHRR